LAFQSKIKQHPKVDTTVWNYFALEIEGAASLQACETNCNFFIENGVILRPVGISFILPPYIISDSQLQKYIR
jgi:adenosylmethionine-8-amino-7-oxononanoate aminotransferase